MDAQKRDLIIAAKRVIETEPSRTLCASCCAPVANAFTCYCQACGDVCCQECGNNAEMCECKAFAVSFSMRNALQSVYEDKKGHTGEDTPAADLIAQMEI